MTTPTPRAQAITAVINATIAQVANPTPDTSRALRDAVLTALQAGITSEGLRAALRQHQDQQWAALHTAH